MKITFEIEPNNEEHSKKIIQDIKEQFKEKKIVFNKNNKTSDKLIKRLPFTIKCYDASTISKN
jgi:hypothetical protein